MNIKLPLYLLLLLIGTLFSCIQGHDKKENPRKKWSPPNGFVSDEQTASKIAEAVLYPIYGEVILNQTPFKVVLVGDSVWVVSGTEKEAMIGGTAYIEINKEDGEILRVTHGR